MKKQTLKTLFILRLVLGLAVSGFFHPTSIYAQEIVPVPTPKQENKELSPVPTPSPEIFSSNQSWVNFKYREQIAQTAEKYEIDPQLIYATIMTESEGNEYAYRYEPHLDEPSLCMGQILVSTARGLGFDGNPNEIYKPEICIDLIGKYYKYFQDNHGSLSAQQMAKAYNSGSPFKRAVSGHLSRFNKWYYESS